MKAALIIVGGLVAARAAYIIVKPLIAWAYNRMTPDIDTDLRQVEYDGWQTLYHSPPIK